MPPSRFGGHRPPLQQTSPSSHSSFCEEVCCSRVSGETRRRRAPAFAILRRGKQRDGYRMRRTGQIFWLLAYNACAAPHLLPAFTPGTFPGIGPVGSRIQLQQRNCSRFTRDFLRRSTFPSSQRTGTRTSGLRFDGQDYLIIGQWLQSFQAKSSNPVKQLQGNFAGCLDFARHDCRSDAFKLI
jgi:hypothetical protein